MSVLDEVKLLDVKRLPTVERMELVRMHAKSISVTFPDTKDDLEGLLFRAHRIIDIVNTIRENP